MKHLYQALFWFLAYIGRPFGGVRPHRFMHWIAHKAFNKADVLSGESYKIKTSWGGVIMGHPFYYLDREVITTGCYDKLLHKFLEKHIKPSMVVFDIGANIGELTVHMAKLTGLYGRIYAFEPAPTLLKRLWENITINRVDQIVRVHDVALSTENGKAMFSFAEIDMENQGMGSLVNTNNHVVSQELMVKTIRMDDFVRHEALKRIDLIKVDIQGGEIDFIKGALHTLSELEPDIVIEVSPSDLACLGKKPEDLIRLLEDIGYKCYLFDSSGAFRTQVTSKTAETMPLSMNVFCTMKL
jgi:FkbM family methyltransferase